VVVSFFFLFSCRCSLLLFGVCLNVLKYILYMVCALSTTIRVSEKTKSMLTKVLIRLESELGRRLDYDEVIRILIERSGFRRPELLLRLKEMRVPRRVVVEARRILEEESRFEEEVFKRRYGFRYKRSS